MCKFFCSFDPFGWCCCCLPFGNSVPDYEDNDITNKDMPVNNIPASRDQFVRASNNSRETYLRDYE